MRNFIYFLLFNATLFNCTPRSEVNIKGITTEFYEVYKARKEHKRFIEFYSDSVVLEDMVNGDRVVGKQALEKFFDWSNTDFQLVGSEALVVKDIFVTGHVAVIYGYFTPFKWGETTFEAMHFSTQLDFDKEGKIVKQVDWINYPSTLLDYSKRKNSNAWIK
jgi:hypoxanthine phosphoribosyltransferase